MTKSVTPLVRTGALELGNSTYKDRDTDVTKSVTPLVRTGALELGNSTCKDRSIVTMSVDLLVRTETL